MLPFVMQAERFEVRSEIPISNGGEVKAIVTKGGVEASPPGAVMSFGATRVGDGSVHKMAYPYINAFPSRKEYETWVEATPRPSPSPFRWRTRSPWAETWHPLGTKRRRGSTTCPSAHAAILLPVVEDPPFG